MTDLHYDTRGSGPFLLVIPGGAGDPTALDPMADVLAEHFTVVTYDPLGLAHGHLGLPVADQRVEDWSEGARRVLDAVLPEGESAYVFGTSAGSVPALDLLTRHPERLRHVIAHEPPCVGLLPDGARQQAAFREVCDVYRAEGPAAAAARMTAVLEERVPEDSAPVGQPLSREEELTNPMALMLAHVLRPFTSYMPKAEPPHVRLTLAAGTDSRGQLLYRNAQILADTLHGDFVELPGGHIGTVQHPAAFAEGLVKTLLTVTAPGVSPTP
ncbi:alpha/beta fold hydrolase [Streptomyces fulvoviolaceus]|uniref:alpha/beta fold hydrolase n=1 Tax=Streptomyces fulvoviolaceus TaxID=285535 RepID=UPI000693CC5F|nr:alpha/beta hydrolase [Streptomyces fulvoviolaceus]